MPTSNPAGLFGNPPERPLSEWSLKDLQQLEREIGRNGEPSELQKQQLDAIREIQARRKNADTVF